MSTATEREEQLIAQWEAAQATVANVVERIQSLKAAKAPKDEIMSAVEELKAAKAAHAALEKSLFPPDKLDLDREAFENLLLRRFFICPSFGIYGGAKGFYDFGPPGCAIKNNLLAFWRQFFVLEENMLEIDTATVTPEAVLKASGHVKKFNDLTVKDVSTGAYHRADHLLEDVMKDLIKAPSTPTDKLEEYRTVLRSADDYSCEALGEVMKKYGVRSPEGNEISEPFPANLMLETSVGRGGGASYLRPETAQGIFVNFGRLLEFNGNRLPFGAATIGTAYRNEIAPRAGLLRVREFTLAEIEHFVFPDEKTHPKFDSVRGVVVSVFSAERQGRKVATPTIMTVGEALDQGVIQNETVGYFMGRIQLFLEAIGIKKEFLMFRQHRENEMAHYAQDCWDAEILTSYGWIEALGIADRACYDLTKHSKASGARMSVFRPFANPREMQVTVLKADKGLIGKAYKKDAKPLLAHLSSLSEEAIVDLQSSLAAGSVPLDIGSFHYELTAEMVSFTSSTKKVAGENITPSVVEPSFGIGRILYALLEHSFYARESDGRRTVVALSPVIAPVKCSVLPLQQNAQFGPVVAKISALLTAAGISNKVDDVGQSIGKRYARTDELGIPFGVTVDFETLAQTDAPTVTLRERDSLAQIRIPISELVPFINAILTSTTTWAEASRAFPSQAASE